MQDRTPFAITDYWSKHGVDYTNLPESEQINEVFEQLNFLLLGKYGNKSVTELLLCANTFTLKLSNSSLDANYKKFTKRLETLQNWNKFLKILNNAGTAAIITVGVTGIILTAILLLLIAVNPLTLLFVVLATIGVYALLIALPTFIYNHYVRPGQINHVWEMLTEKEQLITEVNQAMRELNPNGVSLPFRTLNENFSKPVFSNPPTTSESTAVVQAEAEKGQSPKTHNPQ